MPSKFTKEDFIERAKKVHGDKYDYSKVEYVNKRTKVIITCPIHGDFEQLAQNHMGGLGCPKCALLKSRKTKDEFVKQANEIYGNIYDYSKSLYVNAHTKICIVCKQHGEFWKQPTDHLNGQGCPECSKERIRQRFLKTTEQFIKEASELHDNKYDYSKIEYNGSFNKVPIICNVHGEFMMTPAEHLMGHGCPKCNMSKLEIKIEKLLRNNNIIFNQQFKPKYLKNGKKQLSLDFYLPEYKIAIECQGEQHYKPIKHFGGEERLIQQIEKDKLKKQLCEENNVKLLYFSNEKYDENIITDEKVLLEEILL